MGLPALATTAGIKGAIEAVKTLGTVPVIAICAVAFIMWMNAGFNQRSEESHNKMAFKLEQIEGKVDLVVATGEMRAATEQYFLRQICQNTADSEQERIACNPPPSNASMSALDSLTLTP
jgi:hypothetical protein